MQRRVSPVLHHCTTCTSMLILYGGCTPVCRMLAAPYRGYLMQTGARKVVVSTTQSPVLSTWHTRYHRSMCVVMYYYCTMRGLRCKSTMEL